MARIGVLAAVCGALAVPLPACSAAVADAAGSPGPVPGATVQLPVDGCGNGVGVAGLLAPVTGSTCADAAEGSGRHSPGVLSGAGVRLPVEVPVDIGGDSVHVVGIGGPAVGNEPANGSGDRAEPPRRPAPSPLSTPPVPSAAARDLTDPLAPSAALARTGADGTVPAFAGGTALVLGAAALFRRFRSGADG
ncbi:chaplin family protein [Streptomyces sp. NPDC023723]|uniref:chaplin family protein n=1 Tax=Streptomyces sp. NPDC023723 TaxID=3154323 RepID=UPI0033F90179